MSFTRAHMDDSSLVVPPPRRIPLLLRSAVLLAEKITGKEALPARLLSRFWKGVDMNAATWKRAGLSPEELHALLAGDQAKIAGMGARASAAARYATALSATPVAMAATLVAELRACISEREIVVLATTIAQVNFWSRFNQGLGVPAAGFFDERACVVT